MLAVFITLHHSAEVLTQLSTFIITPLYGSVNTIWHLTLPVFKIITLYYGSINTKLHLYVGGVLPLECLVLILGVVQLDHDGVKRLGLLTELGGQDGCLSLTVLSLLLQICSLMMQYKINLPTRTWFFSSLKVLLLFGNSVGIFILFSYIQIF